MKLNDREMAIKYDSPYMTEVKASRLAEANNLEERLFESLECYHKAQANKDADLINLFNKRVNELTRQYARYCA